MDKEANSSSRSSGASADSYIGSLISLTSKSEIRYEGILYNINTEESSIGLRNVRSFGSEGRKKDGQEIPPSDKIYEYILFRGTDIKDLQVKSSPPVQPTQPLNNDPAIIQSHYPRPVSTSTSLPSAGSGSLTDINSQSGQLGLPGSNFQGGLPLYQPGGNLGNWGASPPPSANGSGLAMPMYWQGYYGPPNGLTHMQQQPLLRPPHGLSMPPSMQQPIQYPNFSATLPTSVSLPTSASSLTTSNLPEAPSPLLPAATSSINPMPTSLPSSSLPLNLPLMSPATLASEIRPSSALNFASGTSLPAANLSASLPLLSPSVATVQEINPVSQAVSNKANVVAGQTLSYQSSSQPASSVVGPSDSIHIEAPKPSLVTPGQLLQSGPSSVDTSQPSQVAHKDVEVIQVSSSSSDHTVPVATEAQPPILPLPVPSRAPHRPNGAPLHNRYGYRGRERGRGSGGYRHLTKFTEDFDFEAMNEKFKKDEVWGHLGKSSKPHPDDNGINGADYQEEEEDELQKIEIKPVYNKDDFFDSLSSNALDHESHHARPRFSEQLKLDTETFGDFARYRGGRGGRGPYRGSRSRGGYYGRGGYGYGYGYVGRGQGRCMSSRAP